MAVRGLQNRQGAGSVLVQDRQNINVHASYNHLYQQEKAR
mgnify:CR=1 FL=1